MGFFNKRKDKKKMMTVILKSMIKPILIPLVSVIDATLEGWKLTMIVQMKAVNPDKLVGFFCDSVDELRRNITGQIKKSLDD